MKKILKWVGVLLAVLVVAAVGFYVWAATTAARVGAQTFDTHIVDFPIPFPLDPGEVAAGHLTDDAARQLATERAVERGKHLVAARYTCTRCHGANFGGGVLVDTFLIGRLLAPNLTLGAGSVTTNFTARDWDRIVRHGVLPDGHPAVMPSDELFQHMSDQELSDIISYIRSLPPVNNTVPRSKFGPLLIVLVAMGQVRPSAATIPSHTTAHAKYPPDAAVTPEFGKLLANICAGCHGPDFSGGPIPAGVPGWPQARNLTPDPTGLAGWTYDQFITAVAQSKKPDGTPLREPMTNIAAIGQSMTDTERHALWAFLQSLPPIHKVIPDQ